MSFKKGGDRQALSSSAKPGKFHFTRLASFFFGLLAAIFLMTGLSYSARAAQTVLSGPAGSGRFGATNLILPNGNIVITDPSFTNAGMAKVGAVYLYSGRNFQLISALIGATNGDQVGSGGIVILANGNFAVSSPSWSNGAGAATWCSGSTGLAGAVSVNNSMTGSSPGDHVSSGGILALKNGNYLVTSGLWNSQGAVTWGDGNAGSSVIVTNSNSLIGTSGGSVIVLSNGNYVVDIPGWNSGDGAVVWGNGSAGTTGQISVTNSLVGPHGGAASVGSGGITTLPNGSYLVSSPYWENIGAITWCSGTGGTVGYVAAGIQGTGVTIGNDPELSTYLDRFGSFSNVVLPNGNYLLRDPGGDSGLGFVYLCNGTNGYIISILDGSSNTDRAGSGGIVVLPTGDFVVLSPAWNGGCGAATWGSRVSGFPNFGINTTTSITGSQATDNVGSGGVTILTNGNYVVSSPGWAFSGSTNGGAVTWCSHLGTTVGAVSSANSLVGALSGDLIGSGGVCPLANGNYVVSSPVWRKNSTLTVGAVTWCSGTNAVHTTVSSANSLLGTTNGDSVGSGGIIALSNGNYVVSSPTWLNAGVKGAGAATWGNGTNALLGGVGASNSLVGSTSGDYVGGRLAYSYNYSSFPPLPLFITTQVVSSVVALANGNYAVGSPHWSMGAITNTGAVTWASGATGLSGLISPANSLVGNYTNDTLGAYIHTTNVAGQNVVAETPGLLALTNGDYVMASPNCHAGAMSNAGALTWGNGALGTVGAISAANSLLGDSVNDQLGAGGLFPQPDGTCVWASPLDTPRPGRLLGLIMPAFWPIHSRPQIACLAPPAAAGRVWLSFTILCGNG